MLDYFDISRTLVIAPLRVANNTWPEEIKKWDHLKYLTYSVVTGSEKERIDALKKPAHIYIINRENVDWLITKSGVPWMFDMLVVDELSSFKSYQSKRFKALLKVRPKVKRIVGLTGTPSSNGLMDLWAEFRLLDMGERIGRYITHYRQNFFVPDKRNQQMIFSYKPKDGAEKEIYQLISDIAISMKARDFLKMPECIMNEVVVSLSEKEQKLYDSLEKDMVLSIGDDEIDAVTAAALSNKLLQMANGAVYNDKKESIVIHDRKLDALEDLIEGANGKPVLVAYWFKHDLERIKAWKKGESYKKGQKLEYKLGIGKGAKWKKLSIGSSASSKSISISLSGYYPNKTKKLGYIKFRVRGCGAKKSWSKWNTKTYDILIPRKAGSLSFSLSDTYSNVGTFSWKVATDSSERQMFTNIEYQSQLTTSGETNGKKLSWNSKKAGWLSGTGGSEGSHSITEDTAVIATGSHIRWFRIRARGVQGNSDWVYAKHVYALSRAAKINFAKAMPNDVGGISVLVDWTAPSDSRTPIDKTTVQWTISVPKEGLTCSDDASWTDAGVSKDTGGNDRAQFSIDRLVKEDSCLFVRVNNEHDGKITYGTPHTAIIEKLKAPTFTKLDVNMETKKVTITATNNSEVPDSKLAVLFRSSDNPNASILIGVMEHGENIATFDCPYLGEEEDNSFGIYAFQGNHSEYINEEQITEFKVSVNAKSDETWKGGEIPLLAKNVKVVSLKEGSVQVTWNWTGDKNEGAIISWADHIDAWESTDEPSTYTINRLYDGKWNIHGLETGRTWYIRVRLTTESGENITAGPWSDILSIDLSSAPAIPTLVLSDNVVTESGSVSASWIYVSSDGSRQGYGEICEVEITSSGIRYGDIIAHTNSSQGGSKVDV